MSQADVLDLLTSLREAGDERFLSAVEIRRLLESRGVRVSVRAVRDSITRLLLRGMLEVKLGSGIGGWKGRKYRVSEEYLKALGLR